MNSSSFYIFAIKYLFYFRKIILGGYSESQKYFLYICDWFNLQRKNPVKVLKQKVKETKILKRHTFYQTFYLKL